MNEQDRDFLNALAEVTHISYFFPIVKTKSELKKYIKSIIDEYSVNISEDRALELMIEQIEAYQDSLTACK
jgi:hypothetical protein